ncbi:hypothetical protein [Benzoatithermus flavus]|uniref:Uncharacterized protein n=1 Tax=Benzoatithermus flavus TaxID=3108223 RepID=A0ABU8XTS8_9PROT
MASGCALLLLLATAACERSGRPGASPAVPASPSDYPDLASVPPRPHLSYTVEQRRAIADALVADRENARHRAAELAYATGQSKTPPPAAPAPAAAETAGAPQKAAQPAAAGQPPGDAAIARAYVEENLNAAADDGRLRKFMRRLGRKIPDPYGPASITEALGLSGPAQPAEGAAPASGGQPPAAPPAAGARQGKVEAQPGAIQRFGSYLGGLLGLDEGGNDGEKSAAGVPQPVATTAAVESPARSAAHVPRQVPAAGSVVARVSFAPRSTSLAADARSRLAQAVEIARAAGAGLRIVAPAAPAGLGIDRGRQVAMALMQAGASASQLELSTGGVGDEVVVYLAASRPS